MVFLLFLLCFSVFHCLVLACFSSFCLVFVCAFHCCACFCIGFHCFFIVFVAFPVCFNAFAPLLLGFWLCFVCFHYISFCFRFVCIWLKLFVLHFFCFLFCTYIFCGLALFFSMFVSFLMPKRLNFCFFHWRFFNHIHKGVTSNTHPLHASRFLHTCWGFASLAPRGSRCTLPHIPKFAPTPAQLQRPPQFHQSNQTTMMRACLSTSNTDPSHQSTMPSFIKRGYLQGKQRVLPRTPLQLNRFHTDQRMPQFQNLLISGFGRCSDL